MMSDLRKYIRLLIEGMTSPNSVSGKYAIWCELFELGAALNDIPPGTEINFVMYDWSDARENLKYALSEYIKPADLEAEEIGLAIYESTVAVLRCQTPSEDYPCNGAWEVIRAAADGGLGPTLYDMVMSISPNGLTSDRRQVSNDARRVWGTYANKRSSIDKDILDPDGYTFTTSDDCITHASRNDMVIGLTRQMAIDFYNEMYPGEHERFTNEAVPSFVETLSNFSDGDSYVEEVTNWLFKDNATQSQIYEDFDDYGFDPTTVINDWFDYKAENEERLLAYRDSNASFEEPDFLDLSYNTGYARKSFEEMQENHMEWLSDLSEELAFGEITGDGATLDQLLEADPYSLQSTVLNFFRERT